jgi:hypothetical protein
MTPTIDHAVTADLAVLASDVRHAALGLAAILPRDDGDDQTLLGLATTYIDRVSRAAAGAALFAVIAGTLVLLEIRVHVQTVSLPAGAFHIGRYHASDFEFIIRRFAGWLSFWLEDLNDVRNIVVLLAFAAAVGGAARKSAAKRFARTVDMPDPIEAGRNLVARSAPWFVALWTSGLVALCAFFAMTIAFHISDVGFVPMWNAILISPGLLEAVREHFEIAARVRDVCIAVSVTTLASVWLARRRPAWLRAWPIAWLALVVALLAFRFEYQLGVEDATHYHFGPDDARPTPVVIASGLALFISLASFALRSVHRRK